MFRMCARMAPAQRTMKASFVGGMDGGLWLPNISRAPINSSIVASAPLLSLMDNQRTHCESVESYLAVAERKRKTEIASYASCMCALSLRITTIDVCFQNIMILIL